MEITRFQILSVILGSTVLGSAIAAGITACFDYQNDQEQRELQKQQLYFEKTIEAYQEYDKAVTSYLIYLDKMHHDADMCIRSIDPDKSAHYTLVLIDSLLRTNDKTFQSFSRSDIDIYIDLTACEPSDYKKNQRNHYDKLTYLQESLRSPLFSEVPNQLLTDALTHYIAANKNLQRSELEKLENIRKAIKKKFTF